MPCPLADFWRRGIVSGMRINILGPSGDTICEDLDAAGINYERCQALPVPGSVYNAGMGEWLELAEGNALS